MKTSFYFVIWILIYPLLNVMGISGAGDFSLILAIAAVWGLSALLRKAMPHTLFFSHIMSMAPLLEDVYTDNVAAVRKRLRRDMLLQVFTSVYFLAAIAFMIVQLMRYQDFDAIGIVIFVFLAIGSVTRSNTLYKAYQSLTANPTKEQCIAIVDSVYRYGYAAYAQQRGNMSYAELLAHYRPRTYTVYQIVAVVFAVLCSVLGAITLLWAVVLMGGSTTSGVMLLLYGSLALYYGITDSISVIAQMRRRR